MSTKALEVSSDDAPYAAPDPRAREWMAGFFLVGLFVALLSPLLVAWQYHIEADPELIGLHFLALAAGYVFAAALGQRLLSLVSMRALAVSSCLVGVGSLVALSFLVPPVPAPWRILGLGFVGFAAGGLATAILYALRDYFAGEPAEATTRAGILFGSGSLIATLMVGLTYFAGSVQIETALLAVVPLLFVALFAANKYPAALVPAREHESDALRETLRDLRSIATVLLSLLLFFQFGNEWAIAGWLPLFLIHRLGSNPVWAIFMLAGYFLALMLGRLAAQELLPRVSHHKLLLAGIFTAILGNLLLTLANSLGSAWIAIVLIGAGFAPIYPLVAEKLDDRFSYHPGFYNGTISIAITGAMCAPWLVGYVAASFGMRYVMLVPAFGSVVVLILTLLITLEAHLMTDRPGVS